MAKNGIRWWFVSTFYKVNSQTLSRTRVVVAGVFVLIGSDREQYAQLVLGSAKENPIGLGVRGIG
jgi:hypothetical protein